MATVTSVGIRSHARELSADETEEVVGIVADLLVNFIKARSPRFEPNQPAESRPNGQKVRKEKPVEISR